MKIDWNPWRKARDWEERYHGTLEAGQRVVADVHRKLQEAHQTIKTLRECNLELSQEVLELTKELDAMRVAISRMEKGDE